MLNPHEAHRKGENIISAGVLLSQLEALSTCFGLSNDPGKRAEQIEKNRSLVEASGGMLAHCHGQEKGLSVATSHWTSFAKAVVHGCDTPRKALQDSTGCLNKGALCFRAPNLETACDKG